MGVKIKNATLTLKPLGGLCNRLYAIESAIALCEELNFDLNIIWLKNKWLNASFFELFDPLKSTTSIRFEEFDKTPLLYTDKTLNKLSQRVYNYLLRGYQSTYFDKVFHGHQVKALIDSEFDFSSLNQFERPYLSTWIALRSTKIFSSRFRVHDDIVKETNAILNRFPSKTVGVHIRRTDHIHTIQASPLESYIKNMNLILAKEPDTFFFLASDSSEVKEKLKSLFPEKVITHSMDSGDRMSLNGMQEAVKDLYLLSKTSRILGNSLSTFTTVASELGGIPLEEVSVQ